MNTVIVPISAIESAGRLLQAACLVARSIPADLAVVLGEQVQDQEMRARIRAAIPTGVHTVIFPHEGTVTPLSVGVACAKQGRSFLVVDAETAASEALNSVVAGWQGPIIYVPDAGAGAPGPQVATHTLVALAGPDDEAARKTVPFATRFALSSGAALAVTLVITPEDFGAPGDPSGRESTKARYSDYYIAQHYLSQVAERLRNRQIRTTWEIRTGPTDDELARLVETTSPDLVIISPSLQHVARQVAIRSGKPVLMNHARHPISG